MKVRFILPVFIFTLLLCACPPPDSGSRTDEGTESPATTPAPVNPGSGTKADPFGLIVNTPSTKQFNGSTPLYYAFSTDEGGIFDIELSCASDSSMTFYAGLFSDAAMSTNIKSSMGTATGFSGVELAPGNYFLMVGPKTSEPLSFTVTVRRTGNLSFEGTKANPIVLTAETPHNGMANFSFSEDKTSYYTFDAPADGMYSITTANVTGGNLNFQVYSAATYDYSSYITSINNSSTGISQVAVRGGPFYLNIRGYQSGVRTYTLTISKIGDYPAEGSKTTPINLELGTPHATGKIGCVPDGQNSYYRFTVSEAGLYDIDATGLGTTNLGFFLYNDAAFSHQVIYDNTTYGLTDCQLDAGAWYLKVSNASTTASAAYTLNITGTPGARIQEGTSEAPFALDVPSEHAGTVGHDYHFQSFYSFTTTQSGVYRVQISNISSGGVNAYLFDEPGFSDFVRSDTEAPIQLEIGSPTAEPRTWYLRVENTGSNVYKTYTISITRNRDYDPEGSVASPVELTLGTRLLTKVEGAVGLTTSYYTFTTVQDGLYDIDPDNLDGGKDFELFSDPGFNTQVAARYNTTAGIIGRALREGTYYLSVGNYYAIFDEYGLTVSRTGDFPSDGSLSSPRALNTAGTATSVKVGPWDSGESNSYYSFTVEEGTYAVQASGLTSTLAFTLFSDSAFTAQVVNEITTTGLTARTFAAGTYYLRVYNSRQAPSYSFNITIAQQP